MNTTGESPPSGLRTPIGLGGISVRRGLAAAFGLASILLSSCSEATMSPEGLATPTRLPQQTQTSSAPTQAVLPTKAGTPSFLVLPTPGPIDPLTEQEVSDLVNLNSLSDCRFPCWGGLTPGQSAVQDLAPFFGRFDVDASDISTRNSVVPSDPVPLRVAELSIGAASDGIGTRAIGLGLDYVSVFWNPVSGTVRALWLSYSAAPPELGFASLVSKLGRPSMMLMESLPTETSPKFRLLFVHPGSDALALVEVSPREWPYLCLGEEDIGSLDILFVSPEIDPMALREIVIGPSHYLEDPTFFTGQEPNAVIDKLSSGGCVALTTS